jgi:hypothetical protein
MYLDLHDRPLGGEDGNGGNVLALEVHQHGGNVQPIFYTLGNSGTETSTVWVKEGPVSLFKGLKNNICVPSSQRGANMQCVCDCHAMLAQYSTHSPWETT